MKIIEVFNTYLDKGGEEVVVDQIYNQIKDLNDVKRFKIFSADWVGENAPNILKQLSKIFYNSEKYDDFVKSVIENNSQVALFHNIYPVGSPALYKAALDLEVPIIQYVHNFRPFSVSGTLWTGSEIAEQSLKGNYLQEVKAGAWQGSVIKSALFALLLKKLHYQGWLDSVKHWVAISDFMRDKFIEAGIAPENITTLRHSWDTMPEMPKREDKGYYLFLSRLTSEKGVQVLLNAWSLLEVEMGDATPLLYIGGKGELEPDVLKACEASDKVRYLGFIDKEEKAELIRCCRAMLAPSVWWEPLGLVTYEAYDFGKPMLASESGGLTETILDGETGFHFQPNDVKSLLKVIAKTEGLSNEDRLLMGDKGRDWLMKNASPEKWKEDFHHIVNKVAL